MFAVGIAKLGGDLRAHMDAAFEGVSDLDVTVLTFDYFGFWLRDDQLKPDGPWSSWGAMTGRDWGKTLANAVWIHREVMAGRAPRFGMMAQGEDETLDYLVEGETGLIEVAPPWERPVLAKGKLVYANGAKGYLHTPERPGDIRGPGYHLFWCSEFCAWPAKTREEAWTNAQLTTRLGQARHVWDTTPKKGHPIMRRLLERHKRHPERHHVVRGSIRANAANIPDHTLEDLYELMGGTAAGEEELEGVYHEQAVGALVKMSWIVDNRALLPDRLDRRVLAIDPAISMRRNTDPTGIIEGGSLGSHYYCIASHGGRLEWEAWGRLVVELWIRNRLDCIIVERNRGGDAVAANIRACARQLDIAVRVVPVKEVVRKHDPKLITIKEQVGRSGKLERLEPVAPLYELGRIHHVETAELTELDETLTTWEPGEDSPNDMDAWVWCMWELAGLGLDTRRDRRRDIAGMQAARKELKQAARPRPVVGRLLPRDPGGSRI